MVSKPVAIVTGASSGIGSAIANRLARTGATVAVHYKGNEAGASAVFRSIEADGGSAFAVGADVSKPNEVVALTDVIVKRCGKIDILVNNAGILEYGLFGQIDPASFERQFSTNTLSVLLMMQAAVPHFPSTGGRIVNVSTNLAYRPIEGCVVYSASKAAVSALTEGFSKELAKKHITVNAVAPGATMTPMTAWLTDDLRSGIEKATPLGRMAVPDDIADVVAFLASDGARWITGRTLLADGPRLTSRANCIWVEPRSSLRAKRSNPGERSAPRDDDSNNSQPAPDRTLLPELPHGQTYGLRIGLARGLGDDALVVQPHIRAAP